MTKIDVERIPLTPGERISPVVKKVSGKAHVIDVHSHIFDTKCINKSYFILRFIKDILGFKMAAAGTAEFSSDEAYNSSGLNTPGWQEELADTLQGPPAKEGEELPLKGIIEGSKAVKFLTYKKMSDVYDYYLEKFSLAEIMDLDKENVISTALTMDLETGWGVRIDKSMYEQITELRELATKKPILPFLYCDPRRADLPEGNNENLYELFNYAFCESQPFFGVKIYPALGYSPYDYRLWPVFEVCEKLSIPVLTHCGGESVSTDKNEIYIWSGKRKTKINAGSRKEMAYNLNNPQRWEPVLRKFPKLRLDFGHFGGYETWNSAGRVSTDIDKQQRKNCIFRLMRKYPNVYADFAYNIVEEDLDDNLIEVLVKDKLVRERTLFGTDFWMVTPAGNLREVTESFIDKLKKASGNDADLARMLVLDNPSKYLFGV